MKNMPSQDNSKKKISRVIKLPDFKQFYKAVVTKAALDLHRNRHIDKWGIIDEIVINSFSYGNPIFHKSVRNMNSINDKLSYK